MGVVVVEDVAAFELRYGSNISVAGQWNGGLSNSGEELVLLDSLDNELVSVNYSDGTSGRSKPMAAERRWF